MNERGQRLLEAAEKALGRRELTQAAEAFRAAETAGADPNRCAAGCWLLHMLAGDFEAAWRQSDSIRARHHDPDAMWRGEDITGKQVMLRCLHGYGDAVQFLRFAPKLRERAASLKVEVAPQLLELVRYIDGIDEVITWGQGAPSTQPAWDVQIEINELPYMLRVQPGDLQRAGPYLRLPRQLLMEHRPAPRCADHLKVGLIWSAGAWNPSRSIPFSALKPLFEVSGCEFWNLQGDRAREEWQPPYDAVSHLAEDCADSVTAFAAYIAQMDLVITCDTLGAHLAGAQDTPCWLLLQHAADWRWQHGRDDTPWYRTLRLFRLTADQPWDHLLLHVAEQLGRCSSFS